MYLNNVKIIICVSNVPYWHKIRFMWKPFFRTEYQDYRFMMMASPFIKNEFTFKDFLFPLGYTAMPEILNHRKHYHDRSEGRTHVIQKFKHT